MSAFMRLGRAPVPRAMVLRGLPRALPRAVPASRQAFSQSVPRTLPRALPRTIPASRQAFSQSALRCKKDVVEEHEVPVSVYAPDSKGAGTSGSEHFSIPVDRSAIKPTAPPAPETEDVHPLTDSVYNTLPPTVKKMTIKDKLVVVTGGARGLGNHMARACAEAGAKAIIIFDVQQELGDEAAAELHEKTGLPVSFYKIDVRDNEAINAAVDAVVKTYGAPDVLINSAGIADSNIRAETHDPAMFRRMIDINLTGSFLMAQSCGKAMIKAGKPGSMIFVASMSGSIVNYPQEQACYNASKAGVIQLGKSLAAEWAKYNIRVNMISPGYMDTALNRVPALEAQKKIWTGLTPQRRLGNVDDLNGLAIYLASDSSGFMTGTDCKIDGGYTLY